MQRLITHLGLLAAVVLSLLASAPLARSIAANAGGRPPANPSSTLADVGIYPLIASGKTDIAVAVCSDTANAQLRSEQSGVFLSQIYVRATACPAAVAHSWRIVVGGAVPGECFTVYAWASEAVLSEVNFMARAARYTVCVNGLGQISPPQRQPVTAPAGVIETPPAGATVQGTITVSGWAIDLASWGGPGVDQVQVYSGATLLGDASYGQARSDIASAYGDSRYTNSGYTYQLDTTRLANGARTIQVRYYNAGNRLGSLDRVVTVDNPTVGKPVPQPIPPNLHVGDWPVPYYSQGDPTWRNNKIGACTNNIGNVGCGLTSLAMIFKFYGASQNPGTLNNCLGSDACLLNWSSSKITSCSGGKVTWSEWPKFKTQAELYSRLDQELKTRPVILELHNSTSGGSHFIVVVGGSGGNPSNYRVNDPGVSKGERSNLKKTLDFWYTYKNLRLTPFSMRLYSGTQAVMTADIQPDAASRLEAPQPSAGEIVSGAVVVYTNSETGVILALAAQSSAGAVTDMRIWTDQHPSDIWQPFSPYVQVPLDGTFYAQFRDAVGNTSAIVEADVPIALSTNIQQDLSLTYLPLIKH
jgi:hypothetical protein